jgi:hypothetical protein
MPAAGPNQRESTTTLYHISAKKSKKRAAHNEAFYSPIAHRFSACFTSLAALPPFFVEVL